MLGDPVHYDRGLGRRNPAPLMACRTIRKTSEALCVVLRIPRALLP